MDLFPAELLAQGLPLALPDPDPHQLHHQHVPSLTSPQVGYTSQHAETVVLGVVRSEAGSRELIKPLTPYALPGLLRPSYILNIMENKVTRYFSMCVVPLETVGTQAQP